MPLYGLLDILLMPVYPECAERVAQRVTEKEYVLHTLHIPSKLGRIQSTGLRSGRAKCVLDKSFFHIEQFENCRCGGYVAKHYPGVPLSGQHVTYIKAQTSSRPSLVSDDADKWGGCGVKLEAFMDLFQIVVKWYRGWDNGEVPGIKLRWLGFCEGQKCHR